MHPKPNKTNQNKTNQNKRNPFFQFPKSLSLDLILLDYCLLNRKVQTFRHSKANEKASVFENIWCSVDRKEVSLHIQFWNNVHLNTLE